MSSPAQQLWQRGYNPRWVVRKIADSDPYSWPHIQFEDPVSGDRPVFLMYPWGTVETETGFRVPIMRKGRQ